MARRTPFASLPLFAVAAAVGLACASESPAAQTGTRSAAPPPALAVGPDSTLDDVVAPIALYPDNLLAIVLPASNYPLDLVQAERFLDRLAKDETQKPDPSWDESVRNLLNTPDVVRMMAANLDWTIRLGEEVAADQGAVLAAIQRFRRQVQGAGNLKTDDKQTVVTEEDVIQLQSADPKVVYVPQYDPAIVVAPAPYPVVSYYPTPYPWYYYPWGAGAAWTAGAFFGATSAFALSWAHHEIWHDVDFDDLGDIGDIDIGDIDIDRGDIHVDQSTKTKIEGGRGEGQRPGAGERPGGGAQGDRPGRPSTLPADRPGGGSGSAWRPGSGQGGAAGRPSQLPATRPSARPGDAGYRPSARPSAPISGLGAAGAGRPSTLASTRPGAGASARPGTGASTRPSYGAGSRPGGGASTRPGSGVGGSTRPGGGVSTRPSGSLGARPTTRPSTLDSRGRSGSARSGSFSGYGSSRDVGSYSSRGRSSRSSMSASGGGGYSRGGGGYRGGGGRGGGGRGGGGRR